MLTRCICIKRFVSIPPILLYNYKKIIRWYRRDRGLRRSTHRPRNLPQTP